MILSGFVKISSVFIRAKKVNAVDKKKKSEEFKKKKQISEVKVDKLSAAEYQENTSNILRILEQYLDMKR